MFDRGKGLFLHRGWGRLQHRNCLEPPTQLVGFDPAVTLSAVRYSLPSEKAVTGLEENLIEHPD